MILLIGVNLAVLVVLAVTLVWGWRHGTLRSTEQERIDFEFERIARRLD